MPKNSCIYNGVSYSHGSEKCQEDSIKRCVDGDWVDLGRPCVTSSTLSEETNNMNALENYAFALNDGAVFTRLTEQNLVIDRLKSLDQESSHTYSVIKTLNCSTFEDAGNASTINLKNTCNKDNMITVRWFSGNHSEDSYYRLPASRSRPIRSRGQKSRIIEEGDWDFNKGDNASEHVYLRRENIGGQTVWILKNTTWRYICFKVDVWQNNSLLGYSTGIAQKLENMRIFLSPSDAPTIAFLNSARYELD